MAITGHFSLKTFKAGYLIFKPVFLGTRFFKIDPFAM